MGERLRSSPRFAVPEPADFQTLLHRLTSEKVKFIVIGGMAMVSHGSAFITADLDICYERSDTNLEALARALRPLRPYLRGAPPGLPFHLDGPTLKAGLNFTLTTVAGDLDLLGEVKGVGQYEDALAGSAEYEIYGRARTAARAPVRLTNLWCPLANKAGRQKNQRASVRRPEREARTLGARKAARLELFDFGRDRP
jgi:hypothetical protein